MDHQQEKSLLLLQSVLDDVFWIVLQIIQTIYPDDYLQNNHWTHFDSSTQFGQM